MEEQTRKRLVNEALNELASAGLIPDLSSMNVANVDKFLLAKDIIIELVKRTEAACAAHMKGQLK